MLEQQTIFEFGRIQSPHDWLAVGVGLAGLLAASIYLYRRDTAELARRFSMPLTVLRCAALLCAFVVFLDPRWRVETVVEQPSRVAVLVDDSASMKLEDAARESDILRSRRDRLKECLSSTSLLDDLAKTHEVEILTVGKDVRTAAVLKRARDRDPAAADVDSGWLDQLEGDQQESRLGDGLDSAFRRNQSGPLAGVVLFTDGDNNAGAPLDQVVKSARRRKVPVVAVGFGRDQDVRNLRVVELQSPSRAFRGDEMPVVAGLQSSGFSSRPAKVSLLIADLQSDAEPQLVATKEIVLDDTGGTQNVEFQYVPEKVGGWRLILRAEAPEDELVLDDNETSNSFDVVDKKTKVLLFAGGPTRDYRFVRSMLYRDNSTETSVYLQSSPQAVAQDADHVLMEFPRTREELYQYDVIVSFDANWGELHPESRDLLVEWVSKQAGGLIMVAGPIHSPLLARNESLSQVLQLFPVQFRELILADSDRFTDQGPWPLKRTSEGESAEFLSLADEREQSARVWEQFDGVFSTLPIQSVKPGATVLAELATPRASIGGAASVMVSHYYGAGRVLYIGTSELWRLRRLGEKYYDRLWIQSVRHFAQGRLLLGASRGSLVLDAERAPLGQLVPVRARILDAEFRPAELPGVEVSVAGAGGEIAQLQLEPEGVPGQFRADFAPRVPGEYLLQLLVPGSDDIVERRLQVVLPDLERQSLRQDRQALEKLASATGGRYFTPDQVEQIPSVFQDRSETSVLVGSPIPCWDKWYLMVGCVLFLSAEWLIRKLLFLA